ERANLAVDDAPLQHPEAAVGVDVLQPALADRLHDVLDALGDELRTFDLVVLDVNHADAQADLWIEIRKDLELVVAAARELQHEMIGPQRVEEGDQVAPEAGEHRLPAVI